MPNEINSMHYSRNGDLLGVVTDNFFAVMKGCNDNLTFTKTCNGLGADNLQFTHENKLLFTTKEKFVGARILDMEIGIFITKFSYAKNFRSLSISSEPFVFATTADNEKINVWDERSATAIDSVKMQGNGVVKCFPRSTTIFVVTTSGIFLYDRRNLTKNAFAAYDIPGYSANCHVDIAVNCENILVADQKNVTLFELENMKPVRKYGPFTGSDSEKFGCCFNINGQLLLVGNAESIIHVYDAKSNNRLYTLTHVNPVHSTVSNILVNGLYMKMSSSAGKQLDIWQIPE
ncbi:uncharacterized protein LOC119688238 [Teleopsis dalmanni]|uniref:uncharacterized protein LOC119688238 n=1 Tax=Teleopsis dalmanni TaxID=139649 RepID=UPI0018CFDE7C|nr:uncharacterized protein LOC119688238 [Teleopsis dalmanni]